MAPPERRRGLWRAAAWGATLTVAILSLAPLGAPLPMTQGDKLEHLLSYLLLAGWWQLPASRPVDRWRRGLLLVGFGILLELLQGLTAYRVADPWDALANSLGVLLGSGLAASPWGRRVRLRCLGAA